jgi:hypothetical protein
MYTVEAEYVEAVVKKYGAGKLKYTILESLFNY